MFEAEVEWSCPENFPNLSGYKYIAIDLETRDPNLKKSGSGAIHRDGEIIGVAIAVDGWSAYYPIGHREGNLDKRIVLDYVAEVCGYDNTKIFHNAMYDVCWLRAYGIKINGSIKDTMVMLALTDENRMWYSLNSAGVSYQLGIKDERTLKEAADAAGIDPKSEMYKLPAMYVGNYAEQDAELTLKLFHRLNKEIEEQNLQTIFKLETELFPCLIDMKFKGVRVDIEGAHILKQQLVSQEEELLLQVKKETGIEPQIWAARSIGKVFDKLDLEYNVTAKTKAPSFTKNFLQEHKHPVVQKIAKAREINKAHTTFIDTILKHGTTGRIHADINPIKSDQGGTVTGRFSYSNPNLQQIPARNKDLGPMIRGLFLPEREHTWGCFDYSQQEPRLVVHFAARTPLIKEDESVKRIVEEFKNDSVDFHQTVADMANISRSQAKTINLGLFYGMGQAKLQAQLGLSTIQEARKLFDKYHDSVPFVKDLMKGTMDVALEQGHIKTLLGRRCRFDKWEINEYNPKLGTIGTRADIEKKYVENYKDKYPEASDEKLDLIRNEVAREDTKLIRRAMTYKALNKLIQGSAADMTKRAMLDLYQEGIVPHIQIHDELDLSIESQEQAKKIIEIMENAVTLAVPNKVDYESGQTWGEING